MKIALTQLNTTVGDIAGNAEKILEAVGVGENKGANLHLFPELTLTGYPPEDLLLKPSFIKDNKRALKDMAPLIKKSAVVVGFVDEEEGNRYNAAAWLEKGKIRTIYRKRNLPNYGVFDEERYFDSSSQPCVIPYGGYRWGLTLCEDIWLDANHWKNLREKKPQILLNLSASPFYAGRIHDRVTVAQKFSRTLKAPLFYCNLIGGQDELVFDGGSFLVFSQSSKTLTCPQFKEGTFLFEVTGKPNKIEIRSEDPSTVGLKPIDEIYEALLMGLRDYVDKNGFKKVAIGLSGGIDSALVAALATAAIGVKRVIGVTMPTLYNTSETKEDAGLLAKNLKVQFLEIPIQDLFEKTLEVLHPAFQGAPPNVAEENLQARIRGNILMALSNKFGWLILTTGNKSETSTGYSTLYGDTAGGFQVLKDVLKTTVYKLAHLVNQKAGADVIPLRIIRRPPTAELRENQKDEDSLGFYAELDPLIVAYVEKNMAPQEISKKFNLDPSYVNRIISLIDRSEYKRRQAPPGIKITPRSYGRDHRMPITNRYQP